MEDGVTILYEVYNRGRRCGELKVLSLGIAQITRTCETWKWNIEDYEIKRILDGAIMWRGSDQ